MFATRLSSFSCLRILILVASSPAHGTYAQPEVPYPTQLVRIVVPFSAGSTSDLLARTISDRLSTRWQQQIIVENRPGIAGTASVAKAQPDGYTIIMASNGHAILDRISANREQDAIGTDFQHSVNHGKHDKLLPLRNQLTVRSGIASGAPLTL
jgi:tripartite-type tricarboxylate transporter receptor subunit TctC